jgi:hypothetical protein
MTKNSLDIFVAWFGIWLKNRKRVTMPKRFVDSDIWDDPWFCEMPLEFKLFWKYLCDKCDKFGIWKINQKLLNFQMGKHINLKKALLVINSDKERVRVVDNKWFIVGFAEFQYGNFRNSKHAFHKQLVQIIDNTYPIDRVFNTLSDTLLNRVQEEEEEEDLNYLNKETETKKEKEELFSVEKIVEVWNKKASEFNFAKIENITKKRKDKIKARKLSAQLVENFFVFTAKSRFLRGDNDRGWKPDFDWIIANEDNLTKVFEDKYTDKKPQQNSGTIPVATFPELAGFNKPKEKAPWEIDQMKSINESRRENAFKSVS